MLFRFSLYGFLKNQQYYDPFLILAFREKGLSFALIGLLIGFREICINLMEIPTGAIADVVGRRRAMILSHVAYIAAFLIFGWAGQVWMLFAAMFAFSIGEAFRTGTHKAIIFNWLATEGRADEKTRVYGFTRSWSRIGSALSVVIAAVLVFRLHRYSYIFFFSVVPYVMNIVNFLTYPSELDGQKTERPSVRRVVRVLLSALRRSLRSRPLRRLLAESMGFDGSLKVCRDYLQPVLKTAALTVPVALHLADRQRTAVLVGAVYFVQYLMDSYASRHADALARRAGSEEQGAAWLWWLYGGSFAVMGVGVGLGFWADAELVTVGMGVAVLAFVGLSVLQNFWRPILLSRFASHAASEELATVLSIESQGRSLFAAAMAPLLGLAVDLTATEVQTGKFVPVAVLGLLVAGAVRLVGSRRGKTAAPANPPGPDAS